MPIPVEIPPDVKKGDPVSVTTTNKQNVALRKFAIGVGAGMVSHQNANSHTVEPIVNNLTIWARIVSKGTASNGSSPLYGWIELLPAINGEWIDGYLSGTATTTISGNAAVEANSNANVTLGTLGNSLTGGTTQSSGGTVALLTYCAPCACWTFQYGACS